jgi:hypothetical protein
MPVYAEETTVDNTTVETSVEETTVETTVDETTTEIAIDNPDKIEDEATVDNFIEKISTSTLWINVVAIAGSALAVIGMVSKKFGTIIALVRSKADASTIKKELDTSLKETFEKFYKEFVSIKERLEQSESNEKALSTALSIFMVNAKISNSAKSEILKYMHGIKTVSGNVSEEIDKAIKIIEKAEAEEEKPVTPVLDKLTEDVHIALG